MKYKSNKMFSQLVSVVLCLIIFSCNNNTKETNEIENTDLDTSQVVNDVLDDINTNLVLDQNINYQVPTPNELFSIIKDLDVTFDASLLNSTENSDKYTTGLLQALNFGVYSADLAFTSSFGASNEALKYFGTVKTIGDNLKVSNAFDQTVFNRIQQNIEDDNIDSLFTISNETYFNAYSYLEDNDRGATLSLIIFGGWIEGLYIMTNIEKHTEGSELSYRISDQRFTYENLLGFMAKYQDDELVSDMMNELSELEEIFLSFEQTEEEVVTTETKEGKFNLDGGVTLNMNIDQFNLLKDKVNELRTSIIEATI